LPRTEKEQDLSDSGQSATIVAGVPAKNLWLYRRIRFKAGDPAALIEIPGEPSLLIIRDIEMARARKTARAGRVASPAEFAPASGLSGDRETATAQAVAECIRRSGLRTVVTDRSMPMIFAHFLREAGIDVRCDPELGVLERRSKDESEVAALQRAQAVTEEAMALACHMVARAKARADGVLVHDNAPLTSERVRAAVDIFLLGKGFLSTSMIVAGGKQGADCHDSGTGELRTGEPVIIDIYPCDKAALYNGDCTRTVVHGDVPPIVAKMHAAVVEAKRAATAAAVLGATGHQVHEATSAVIERHGYSMGLPAPDAPDSEIRMVHGTGHGVGLDVHEPPLLDRGGPPLVVGDALTIEPGLYCKAVGGVRVEDMVIVRKSGPPENLNRLPEGLNWR
jgi:Xaa-Pro aminopeptidase